VGLGEGFAVVDGLLDGVEVVDGLVDGPKEPLAFTPGTLGLIVGLPEGKKVGRLDGQRVGMIEGQRVKGRMVGKLEGHRVGMMEGQRVGMIEGYRVGVAEGGQPLSGAPANAPAACTAPAGWAHRTQSSDEQLAKAPREWPSRRRAGSPRPGRGSCRTPRCSTRRHWRARGRS